MENDSMPRFINPSYPHGSGGANLHYGDIHDYGDDGYDGDEMRVQPEVSWDADSITDLPLEIIPRFTTTRPRSPRLHRRESSLSTLGSSYSMGDKDLQKLKQLYEDGFFGGRGDDEDDDNDDDNDNDNDDNDNCREDNDDDEAEASMEGMEVSVSDVTFSLNSISECPENVARWRQQEYSRRHNNTSVPKTVPEYAHVVAAPPPPRERMYRTNSNTSHTSRESGTSNSTSRQDGHRLTILACSSPEIRALCKTFDSERTLLSPRTASPMEEHKLPPAAVTSHTGEQTTLTSSAFTPLNLDDDDGEYRRWVSSRKGGCVESVQTVSPTLSCTNSSETPPPPSATDLNGSWVSPATPSRYEMPDNEEAIAAQMGNLSLQHPQVHGADGRKATTIPSDAAAGETVRINRRAGLHRRSSCDKLPPPEHISRRHLGETGSKGSRNSADD